MSSPTPFQSELDIRPAMQPVDHESVMKQSTFSKALILCQTISGKEDDKFYGPGGIVNGQAQWSRIMGPNAKHNFPQDKLNLFMDIAGNEAPLLWLLHSRGYDLHSLRKRETEYQRKLRLAEERIAKLEEEARIKADLFAEALRGRAA